MSFRVFSHFSILKCEKTRRDTNNTLDLDLFVSIRIELCLLGCLFASFRVSFRVFSCLFVVFSCLFVSFRVFSCLFVVFSCLFVSFRVFSSFSMTEKKYTIFTIGESFFPQTQESHLAFQCSLPPPRIILR